MSKVMVTGLQENGTSGYAVQAAFLDGSNNIIDPEILPFNVSAVADFASLVALAQAAILAYATLAGYTVTAAEIVWGTYAAIALPFSFNNTPSHSIVTTAAAANGFQLSATRNANVQYSLTIATTASIGGNASGTVVLEIATTNSTTAADWKEIARYTNGQSISLALTLQSLQTLGGSVYGMVPAGSYARLRSINNAGTPTYTFNSGQEILL